jgi:UDP-N-acetylmuramoylalanine--D-glutamate ligase
MKQYIIYGLGVSGIATLKYLANNNYPVIATDDNEEVIRNVGAKLAGEKNIDKISFLKFLEINWQEDKTRKVIIFAPGIPLYHPKPHPILEVVKKYGCELICDIELFYQKNLDNYNFIGITGTNGKSTTTALTAFIIDYLGLPALFGGNIGNACFDLEATSKGSACIIEMSSFQIDLLNHLHFQIAALTNITADHLDRHGSMSEYIAIKKNIFKHQTKNDYAIIGIDNDNSRLVFESLKNDINFKGNLIPISTKKIGKQGVAVIEGVIYNSIESKVSKFQLGDIFLKGEHNAQNIAVAFAICYCYLKQKNLLAEISELKIIEAIRLFKGLKHRIELVGKINNINFINDSKATNAESSENALKIYDNIYWILGGKAKEGGIEILTPYFSKVKQAYLIGEASDNFADLLAKNQVKFKKCYDLKNAITIAYEDAKLDDLSIKNILLSPACASYDQWKNFEERGDFFIKTFNQLQESQF